MQATRLEVLFWSECVVMDEVESNPCVDVLVLVKQHWAAFSPEVNLHQVLDASADVQDLQQRGVLILDDR